MLAIIMIELTSVLHPVTLGLHLLRIPRIYQVWISLH